MKNNRCFYKLCVKQKGKLNPITMMSGLTLIPANKKALPVTLEIKKFSVMKNICHLYGKKRILTCK